MQVRRNSAWSAFNDALEGIEAAVRLKQIRDRPIIDGRAELHLFERAPQDPRPHPRMRMAFAAVVDPAPPELPVAQRWADAGEFRRWLIAALNDPALLAGLDRPPAKSPHYWFNTLRTRRITAVLELARAAITRRRRWPAAERDAARYALAELGELAFAGSVQFDDEDIGTYHSYLEDKPFVHVLEQLRASLPEPGTPAFALLPAEQQRAVDRQRAQLTRHLDFLMRHKYAYHGITETDIERTLGGYLIDSLTRARVSEDPATLDTVQPRHQIVQVDPASAGPYAGAWLVRTKAGFALADGSPVEVAPAELRITVVPAARLTFARAPNDPGLREAVRFDWSGEGYVEAEPIEWVEWGGYCDIQAVLEAVGVTMLEKRPIREYRSDTGVVTELSTDILSELLFAATELGSRYSRLDGGGLITRGISQFGGARNNSLPDRLQFQTTTGDRHFRWPLSRQQQDFRVNRIQHAGRTLDLEAAFAICLADRDAVDFVANPRYLTTVDGNYNVIDATGMVMSVAARVSTFNAGGQIVHRSHRLALDLRPEATGTTFLGTHIHDLPARELYRVYLDRAQPAVVAQLWRWERHDGSFSEVHDSARDLVIPLRAPIAATVSREMRRDDPAMFRSLIELALHRGQNICADTDQHAPVWNGVVTAMEVERLAVNAEARVERWRAHFDARFGEAELDYLVRRSPAGEPERYCSTATDRDHPQPPDFLWQDLPDVASKGFEQGAWVVNQAMRERGLIDLVAAPDQPSGFYIHDDHIKNSFELLYAAFAGYQYTIVHQNKRYVFTDARAWERACARLDQLRAALSFT